MILTIGGSPSENSKSALILAAARLQIEATGGVTSAINVRDLNAEDLLHARVNSPTLAETFALVAAAEGIIVATPIYKAAYSGILKAYLDMLPANALAGKVTLPLATGASPTHALAIDYALRPVLVALGAQYILGGLYLLDSQWTTGEGNQAYQLDTPTRERFATAVQDFVRFINQVGR